MQEVVERVLRWKDEPEKGCRFVVTPNVDHTVILQKHAGLREAYARAGLVLADGWPVVAASRLLRRPLPGRVPGSDLVPALFEAANRAQGLRVYLLGAAPGVAERAAANIHKRWPAVTVVGQYSPPLGFEKDAMENGAILARIHEAQPDVLVVGLGAPKQELWVSTHQKEIAAPVALCVGATIDFLAGEKRRAPRWAQRIGLEWLHRLASEPKRLARRYAHDAWVFPQLVLKEWIRAGYAHAKHGD
jgi:N-acetylglucosaminyldiphosphoundecaprenol N-acetyl-beta-D-mannosaminyltransferase